jgi:hypothetical protein
MWGYLITWVSILTLVSSQCYVQEVSNTRENGLTQKEIEIDFGEEVQGFLALTMLLRQETFIIRDRYIITSPHDKTCIYLGNGIRLDEIKTSYTKSVDLPLLTQAVILSASKILLTTSEISTVVDKNEFSQLTAILGYEDKVNMAGNRNIVIIIQGSRKILTNFNVADRNICETTPIVTNMAHRMVRLTSEMSEVWNKIQTANLLYGRVLEFDTFAKCLDLTEVTFSDLMLVTDENLTFCRKGLMSRVTRGISVGSFLLGEGSSIMELQSSLHDTITNYNQNFKNMEHFDDKLIKSLTAIEDDIQKMESNEVNLKDEFLQLKQQLEFTYNHFHFISLKEQHVQALSDILIKSDIHENLELLERALFGNNHCTFVSCETKIYAIRNESIIKIHTEVLDLEPKTMMLLTCKAVSSTHVSVWHNKLASLNGDTLILENSMIPISHLSNETIVNKNLRFLKPEEILLKTFHLYGSEKIQCLSAADFLLNSLKTSCFALQTIQLPENFLVEYKGARISKEQMVSHIKFVSNTWLSEYNFDNMPRTILQSEDEMPAVFHPVIDPIILDQAGNISVQKISLLTSGSIIFILLVCIAALYKCDKYRNAVWKMLTVCWNKLYLCCTTENQRTVRENKRLKKEVSVKRARIRENISDLQLMQTLEKSLEENNRQKSLPNLTNSIQMEDMKRKHNLELDHLGASGGTAWHDLPMLREPTPVDEIQIDVIGENSGRNWRDLKRIGQPILHPRK